MASVDALVRDVISMAPCCMIVDHADKLLSRIEDGESPEDAFLKEQVIFFCTSRFKMLTKWHCPVLIVVEEPSLLHPQVCQSSYWWRVVSVERPDQDLRHKVFKMQNEQSNPIDHS